MGSRRLLGASRDKELVSLVEAKKLLRATRTEILGQGIRGALRFAVLLPDGGALYLAPEDIVRFPPDGGVRVPLRELTCYRSPHPKDPEQIPPMPLTFVPFPDFEARVDALRVLLSDVHDLVAKGPPIPGAERVVLFLDRKTSEAKYRGQSLELTDTPFRLLLALAEKPQTLISVEQLMTSVSHRVGEFDGTPARWGRDHKLEIMRALRAVAGAAGASQSEVNELITARSKCMVLNLRADQIYIR